MKKYITKSEYEIAEHRIYNDLPAIMDEDISEIPDKFNQEVAKELLLQGEEYRHSELKPHFIITSYARVINTSTGTIVKPNITSRSLQYGLNNEHYNCLRDFESFGWKYNHKEIVKRFVENKWRYRVTYKGKLEDLFI